MQSGRKFDLEDFRDQLQQMDNMGGVSGMLDKLPGMGKPPRCQSPSQTASSSAWVF